MPQPVRIRAATVFLLISLISLPALGAQEQSQPEEQPGLFAFLWQAVTDLVPSLLQLGPELDPLGGQGQESSGDLGPELDPLG